MATALVGCTSGGGGDGGADGGVDAGDTTPACAAAVGVSDWCAHVSAGAPGTGNLPLDLSRAHAVARFFSPARPEVVDKALAQALTPPAAVGAPDLSAYANTGVACALDATHGTLGAASVTLSGSVAVIRPGSGSVTVPAEAKAVALDLRDLPDTADLGPALDAATALVLARPLPRATPTMRFHDGMYDEALADNMYSNKVDKVPSGPLPAGASTTLPLAVLVSDRLPARAAALAVSLRQHRAAWLFGAPVYTAVAESQWMGVGERGLAVRVSELHLGVGLLPDVFPADRAAVVPALAELPALGEPPSLQACPADRAGLRPNVTQFQERGAAGLGEARAGLIIAHGAVRRFWPYFDIAGAGFDERLVEVLGALGQTAPDRPTLRVLLRRLGAILDDGHTWVSDLDAPAWRGANLLVEELGGKPVVRRSTVPGILPGDTLVTIAGVSAVTAFEEEMTRVSAASRGWRYQVAGMELETFSQPQVWEVSSPGGPKRARTPRRSPSRQACTRTTPHSSGRMCAKGEYLHRRSRPPTQPGRWSRCLRREGPAHTPDPATGWNLSRRSARPPDATPCRGRSSRCRPRRNHL